MNEFSQASFQERLPCGLLAGFAATCILSAAMTVKNAAMIVPAFDTRDSAAILRR